MKINLQVMQKYREHTQQKIDATKLEFDKLVKEHDGAHCASVIQAKSEQVDHLVKMLHEIINDGSKEYSKVLEENAKLKTENLALRHIVNASNEFKATTSVACGLSFSNEDNDDSDELDSSRETIVDAEIHKSDVN